MPTRDQHKADVEAERKKTFLFCDRGCMAERHGF